MQLQQTDEDINCSSFTQNYNNNINNSFRNKNNNNNHINSKSNSNSIPEPRDKNDLSCTSSNSSDYTSYHENQQNKSPINKQIIQQNQQQLQQPQQRKSLLVSNHRNSLRIPIQQFNLNSSDPMLDNQLYLSQINKTFIGSQTGTNIQKKRIYDQVDFNIKKIKQNKPKTLMKLFLYQYKQVFSGYQALPYQFLTDRIQKHINDISSSHNLTTVNQKILDLYQEKFIFLPFSKLRIAIDIWLSITYIIYLFTLSLIIFYDMEPFYDNAWVSAFITSSFVLEFFIQLNTAYLNQGFIIKQRKTIFVNYMKSNFIYDMLGFMPILIGYINFHNSFVEGLINLLAFFKIVNFGDMAIKITEFRNFQGWKKHTLRIFLLVLKLFVLIHFLGILWHGIASYELERENPRQTWLDQTELVNEDIYEKYVYSIYFIAVTMNTVGYGDISPQNTLECIYTTVIMLTSGIMYAYTINEIGNIMREMRHQEKLYKNDVETLKLLKKQEKIDVHLFQRIQNYIECVHNQDKEVDRQRQNILFNKLSKNLVKELKSEIVSKYMKQVTILQERFSQQSIIKLQQKVQELSISSEDIIYQESEYKDQALYYIIQGKVQILYEKEKPENQSGQGLNIDVNSQIYGEFSFFTGKQREATLKALTFCRLLKIDRKDFIDIIKDNQRDYQIFCQIKDNINFNIPEINYSLQKYARKDSTFKNQFWIPFQKQNTNNSIKQNNNVNKNKNNQNSDRNISINQNIVQNKIQNNNNNNNQYQQCIQQNIYQQHYKIQFKYKKQIIKCLTCDSEKHLTSNCKKTHQKFDQLIIIQKHCHSEFQIRNKIDRMLYKYNSKKNIATVQLEILEILKNGEMEEERNEISKNVETFSQDEEFYNLQEQKLMEQILEEDEDIYFQKGGSSYQSSSYLNSNLTQKIGSSLMPQQLFAPQQEYQNYRGNNLSPIVQSIGNQKQIQKQYRNFKKRGSDASTPTDTTNKKRSQSVEFGGQELISNQNINSPQINIQNPNNMPKTILNNMNVYKGFQQTQRVKNRQNSYQEKKKRKSIDQLFSNQRSNSSHNGTGTIVLKVNPNTQQIELVDQQKQNQKLETLHDFDKLCNYVYFKPYNNSDIILNNINQKIMSYLNSNEQFLKKNMKSARLTKKLLINQQQIRQRRSLMINPVSFNTSEINYRKKKSLDSSPVHLNKYQSFKTMANNDSNQKQRKSILMLQQLLMDNQKNNNNEETQANTNSDQQLTNIKNKYQSSKTTGFKREFSLDTNKQIQEESSYIAVDKSIRKRTNTDNFDSHYQKK